MTFREFMRKLVYLPGPVELGKSKHNALPSDLIGDHAPEEYTWEKHYAYLAKHYPIKYFLAHTLTDFIHLRLIHPVSEAWYWLRCHVWPPHRYHMLDLRQPKDHFDNWQWGWRDTDSRILFANFNILRQFVEIECPEMLDNNYKPYPEEMLTDPATKGWNDALLEIKELYTWWMVDREEKLRKNQEMLHTWHESQHGRANKREDLFKEMAEFENAFEKETEAKLIRLIQLRGYMWT